MGAAQDKKFTNSFQVIYEVVSAAVKDQLMHAKLHFFKFVTSHHQPAIPGSLSNRLVPFLSEDLSFMVRGVMKCFIKNDKLSEASDDKLSRILEDPRPRK